MYQIHKGFHCMGPGKSTGNENTKIHGKGSDRRSCLLTILVNVCAVIRLAHTLTKYASREVVSGACILQSRYFLKIPPSILNMRRTKVKCENEETFGCLYGFSPSPTPSAFRKDLLDVSFGAKQPQTGAYRHLVEKTSEVQRSMFSYHWKLWGTRE